MSKLLRYASILFFAVCMPILTHAQCTVNAGADLTRCIYSMDSIALHASTAGNFTTYSWTSSGTGLLEHSTSLTPFYHHTLADITAGSVTLTLTASGGTCGSVTDQIVITLYKFPKVTLQDEFTVCNGLTVPLTSTVAGTSTLQWSTIVGSGTFSSTTTASSTYLASAADSSRGYVLVTLRATTPSSQCKSSDTVRVNFVPYTQVYAGSDETTCVPVNNKIVTSGFGTGYTFYSWTTSGTGIFENPTSAYSAYILSAADIASGSVTLTLTGNSTSCGTRSDSRTITISPTIEVSAGADQSTCANTVSLNGTAPTASTALLEWFNVIGSGTFSDTSILTPIYTIAAADKARGYALLRLRATTIQGCRREDTVRLNISSAPFVSAGANKFSCAGAVELRGVSSNATSRTWTTSGTGTFGNVNRDSTTYTPSTADRNLGQAILTYTATNSCGTSSSTTKISFISSSQPRVNAGSNTYSACGNDTIQLIGSVDNATGGNWSTTGSGTFLTSKAHLINQYKLSAADKVAGSIVFTLTTYDNGGCGSVSDDLTITITPGTLPSVNAGSDQISSISAPLNATVSNATMQVWQTSGTGVFVPNATSVNATYMPSAADIAAESVELTLVATGTCGNVADALTLFTATPSSIKGTIKAGSNVLDRGVVYLFVNTGTLSPKVLVGIDTLVQSDNGVYEFASVPTGFYSVYAVPLAASVYKTAYLSTYFGSTAATEWQHAGLEEVTNGSAAHVLNIDLVAYTSALPTWNTGHDTISGAVLLNTPIMLMRLASSNDDPFAGVVVYLKTLNGQVIAYTSTDKNGAYAFNNVIQGNYFIDTEYPNTSTLFGDKIVAVDGNPQTIEDGNVILYRTALATAVVSSNKTIQVNAYPNPASDMVHIQMPKTGNYSVKVLDEVGALHTDLELYVTSGEIVDISLTNLYKGLYIIQITSGDDVYTTKVVKF